MIEINGYNRLTPQESKKLIDKFQKENKNF